jgi:hypothetical protein
LLVAFLECSHSNIFQRSLTPIGGGMAGSIAIFRLREDRIPSNPYCDAERSLTTAIRF